MVKDRDFCGGKLITRRKGTGLKKPVVSRASMMPMLSRVSMMSEGYSAAAMVLCFGGDCGALVTLRIMARHEGWSRGRHKERYENDRRKETASDCASAKLKGTRG